MHVRRIPVGQPAMEHDAPSGQRIVQCAPSSQWTVQTDPVSQVTSHTESFSHVKSQTAPVRQRRLEREVFSTSQSHIVPAAQLAVQLHASEQT
jgi:hypothetical protein